MKLRKLFAILLSICLIGSSMQFPAFADSLPEKTGAEAAEPDAFEPDIAEVASPSDAPLLAGCANNVGVVTYLSPVYIGGKAANGISEWETDTCSTYEVVADSTKSVIWGKTGQTKWYVADGTVTLSQGVTVSGDVRLILLDGCSLTVNGKEYYAGITVSGDTNSLTIYAQSTEESVMGALTANAGLNAAGIGGVAGGVTGSGSNITINGGKVTADGEISGAGIGGGYSGYGKNILINGGIVTATGRNGGAGIGGGFKESGSEILINGGIVTATGGSSAAGIGGGDSGDGTDITINGGTVTATGHVGGAGIGGGFKSGKKGDGKNITINGGTVVAIGGERASNVGGGAGIGGGGIGGLGVIGGGSDITITGGSVTATGGGYGAGIGGGSEGTGSSISISGGIVTATGGEYGAGIGGGYGAAGSDITITGGMITATGGTEVKGWGSGIGDGLYARKESELRRIYADDDVTVRAGDSAEPSEVIAHEAETDLTGVTSFKGKQYVICECAVFETYLAPVYQDAADVTEGVDSFEVKKCKIFEEITSSSTRVTWGRYGQTKWYVADGTVTLEEGAVIDGDVRIILKDYCLLSVGNPYNQNNVGLTVIEGAKLTIYAQSTGSDGVGELEALGGSGGAGIGGNASVAGTSGSGSNITINGGNITASGGIYGAGIGGGNGGSGSHIVINGGTVTVNAGPGGAGIGGGKNGSGSSLTINGGVITASGAVGGAGIGGGKNGSGSNIIVNNCIMQATGGSGGAGIGGGQGGSGRNISFNGGDVIAVAGTDGPAGVGSGKDGAAADGITAGIRQVVLAGSSTRAVVEITHTATIDLSGMEAFQKPYVSIRVDRTVPPYDPSGDDDDDDSSGAEAAASVWEKSAQGWKYRLSDGRFAANGWYELDNPYASGMQEKKSWFRFGADGFLLTGWFTDTDGRKYYLNPVSDGTYGSMVHGKQVIDGKEYEFSEVHDGYYGHLIEN